MNTPADEDIPVPDWPDPPQGQPRDDTDDIADLPEEDDPQPPGGGG